MRRASHKFDTFSPSMKLLCLPFYLPENRAEKGWRRRGALGSSVVAVVQRRCLLPLTDRQGRLGNAAVWHQRGSCAKWADSRTRHNYSVALPGLTLSVWEAGTAASLLLACEGRLKYHCSIVFSTGSCPHKFSLLKPKSSIHLCPYPSAVVSLQDIGIWQGENYESELPLSQLSRTNNVNILSVLACAAAADKSVRTQIDYSPALPTLSLNRLSSFYLFCVFS